MSKGGPLECGILEFGSRDLSEGVWVGFRPSALEGVSECRGGALGRSAGAGLGLCSAGGRLQGQRVRPGSPTVSPAPKWTGKVLAMFPSLPSRPSPTFSPRVSPIAARPLTMGGSHWVQELLPSPSHPSGVPILEVWPLLLLPLPSLPLPRDLRGWRRPWWAEDQAWDLNRFLGAQVGRGNLVMLPFDPLPSQWSPKSPLRVWNPFPSPSHPSGAPVPSHLHFSSPLTPPTPHVLPCYWGFLSSPQVPMILHWCLVGALVVRRREFRVPQVCHLDSAHPNFYTALRHIVTVIFNLT